MISIFISIFVKNVLSFRSVPLLLHPSLKKSKDGEMDEWLKSVVC